jgi:hypothetical protein
MSTGYQVLVMLHLLCVIGGFGAVAYNGLYVTLARRRASGGGAVLEVNMVVSGLAELLIYAALLFGVGAVAASHSTVKFSNGWVSGAFAVYLVDIGILHGWIRPQQRRYAVTATALEAAAPSAGGAAPPEVALLTRLERRVALGWAVFNVLVVVAVYFMVFKPGS